MQVKERKEPSIKADATPKGMASIQDIVKEAMLKRRELFGSDESSDEKTENENENEWSD